jgi:hypothetical protein
MQACSVACQLSLPTFLEDILNYLIREKFKKDGIVPEAFWPNVILQNGIGLCFVLFSLQVGSSVFRQTSLQLFNSLQINVKTILITAIYEKALRLSQNSSKVLYNITVRSFPKVRSLIWSMSMSRKYHSFLFKSLRSSLHPFN